MLTAKVVYLENKPAFHLYLLKERRNTLLSTIPLQVLKKHFQKELFHIENALVISPFSADRLLEEFSDLILQNEVIHDYFYPTYLLNEGVNLKTAEKLIHLQDNFELTSGMYFSERLNPIEFFHIQQRFSMSKNYILRTAKRLTPDSFGLKYLITDATKFCFRSYANNYEYLLEFEDEGIECALVLDVKFQLKIFITA